MFEFEDHEERQVLCERCRKFVPLPDIKYVAKGNDSKMALCTKCLKNFNVPASAIKNTAAAPSAISYACGRCNYKFKFKDNSHAALRCPYCGRSDKIEETKVTSAEHLLKESADF